MRVLRGLELGILGAALLSGSAVVSAKQEVPLRDALRNEFRTWLDRDADARSVLSQSPLSDVQLSADGLSFVEPDRITLVATSATAPITDDTKSAVRDLFKKFLDRYGDRLLESRGMDKPKRDALLRAMKDNLVVQIGRPQPAVAAFDPFQPPSGLATPADQLLAMRGWCQPKCFVFSPQNCLDLAGYCYRMGLYQDAIALLEHAALQDAQASYFYLKAMAELQIGRCHHALSSVQKMAGAQAAGRSDGLGPIMQRYNGPMRVQLDELYKVANPVPPSLIVPLPPVRG
jgi:hypothetical protein